jgi:hypothetical protein
VFRDGRNTIPSLPLNTKVYKGGLAFLKEMANKWQVKN